MTPINWQEIQSETGRTKESLLKERGFNSEEELYFSDLVGDSNYFSHLREQIYKEKSSFNYHKQRLENLENRLETSLEAAHLLYVRSN